MGNIIGNRTLQGSPMLPYLQNQQLAGQDVYFPLTFLDRYGVPVIPTSIKVELDDLTNAQNMDGGPLTLVSTGSTSGSYIYPAFTAGGSGAPWMLQASSTIMQMTYPYEGSQICKLKIVWTSNDSVTGNAFSAVIEKIIELVSSPSVSGF